MHLKKIYLLFIFCFFGAKKADCQTIQLSIDTILQNSPFIFEGKIVRDSVFTDSSGGGWLSNTVKISKVIQGNVHCGNAEIISWWVDSNVIVSEPYLRLRVGDEGIFMCAYTAAMGLPYLPAPKDNPDPFFVWGDIQAYYGYSNSYDSAFYYWTGSEYKSLNGRQAVFDFLSNRFGHPYTLCDTLDNLSADFTFYPNPVSGSITMNIPGSEPASLMIYDMQGKLLLSYASPDAFAPEYLEIVGYHKLVIQHENLSTLKPGSYIGKAITANHVYPFKLIKL